MNDSSCWRLDALFDPVWRECEGEYFAYDRASGDTHCFDSITAALLLRIQQQSATLPVLTDHVAALLACEPDEALVSHISELLRELEYKKFASSS